MSSVAAAHVYSKTQSVDVSRLAATLLQPARTLPSTFLFLSSLFKHQFDASATALSRPGRSRGADRFACLESKAPSGLFGGTSRAANEPSFLTTVSVHSLQAYGKAGSVGCP
jgi:hypothetical protein